MPSTFVSSDHSSGFLVSPGLSVGFFLGVLLRPGFCGSYPCNVSIL